HMSPELPNVPTTALRPTPDVGVRVGPCPHDQRMPVMEPDMARESRVGQRPAPTWATKSPTMPLNRSGASRLMVCPQFGITERAADGMMRFISNAGARQGQSSSPVRISVGTVRPAISFCRWYSGTLLLAAELGVGGTQG